MTKTIYDHSVSSRVAGAQLAKTTGSYEIPEEFMRSSEANLPEVSELQVVRHYTNLSRKNFGIDTAFYPLGSCTMKYNPRGAHQAAQLPGFLNHHPLAPESHSQGVLECLSELQEILATVTGMQAISLAPMAGAQGELAGGLMIRAYHHERGDSDRTQIIVPTAAHGTNPATAAMCGFDIVEVAVGWDGDVEIDDLKAKLSERTAGIMLTNPSTCAVFERQIETIAQLVHDAGGLLYYDGANLNAILGKVKPGDMGFDVLHLNLHKTFATPHGGGGPGSGPVGASEALRPYLPVPVVGQSGSRYQWEDEEQHPRTIGRLSAFMGNVGILIRAYTYARMLGAEGMERVSEYAVLNANYLARRLEREGFELAYPERRATHEFVLTLEQEKQTIDVTAYDFAKRLLDFGFHAPTTYFPLLIPECFLIEPTETETKETLDAFVEAMVDIREEARRSPDKIHNAPENQPVGRLDATKADRQRVVRIRTD